VTVQVQLEQLVLVELEQPVLAVLEQFARGPLVLLQQEQLAQEFPA
jgi:hypothetical protein